MKKMIIAALALCGLGLASCCNKQAAQDDQSKGYTDKEAIENIFARKSVRDYVADKPVEQEKIDLIVKAGMAAPSGRDLRPWEIVIVNEREVLDRLQEGLPYAQMLEKAPLAIVVCGNSERSSYWYLDCSAVAQNILLAAEALDLGAVWTGAYPAPERMEAVSTVLRLPENVLPLCVIPVGYPEGEHAPKDKYDAEKVHYNVMAVD